MRCPTMLLSVLLAGVMLACANENQRASESPSTGGGGDGADAADGSDTTGGATDGTTDVSNVSDAATDSSDAADASDTGESPSLAEVEGAEVTAIGGVVRDAVSLGTVRGALISTDPPTGSVFTNADGEFAIDIRSSPTLENFEGASIRINVNKVGYTANSTNIVVVEGDLSTSEIFLFAEGR